MLDPHSAHPYYKVAVEMEYHKAVRLSLVYFYNSYRLWKISVSQSKVAFSNHHYVAVMQK